MAHGPLVFLGSKVITVPRLSSHTLSKGTRIPDAAVNVIDILENNNDNRSKSATG